jgi:NAD(P)-dependent dehydrogenase (short-subunit alcohol dehydrogenase family)
MDNPFSLEGKRILVTGASSGIGRQIAISCAGMGASVVLTGRDAARLADTRTAIGDAVIIAADLTNIGQRNELADTAGPLHGVVHSAGATALSPIRMATEKHLRTLYELDYEAPFLLTQRLLAKRAIQNNGSILFISSLAAYIGVAGVGAYSGMKAAVISTARCLALEVLKQRIRVNCLAPSFVKGPLLDGVNTSISDSVTEYESRHPLGFGTADDVANAAIYFLSDASKWITGQVHVMDGGYSIN